MCKSRDHKMHNSTTVIITSDEILPKSYIFASCGKVQALSESTHQTPTKTHKALQIQKNRVSYNLCMHACESRGHNMQLGWLSLHIMVLGLTYIWIVHNILRIFQCFSISVIYFFNLPSWVKYFVRIYRKCRIISHNIFILLA